ncbi:MAG: UDP-2,3-diacylglucosamine diphosphatase LpxI [Candidatus Omnitrophota bacterium]|nr:UDP-2,3-diacylglucosamine diphosphatase LpxI [Candidatus Omnitrophota bacterium]
MKRIGLIAGGGALPFEFIKSAKRTGSKVIVFAIKGMADAKIAEHADKIYWMDIGQYKKFLLLLLKERIRNIAMIGKVEKNVVYDRKKYDGKGWRTIENLKGKEDYSVLAEVTRHLNRFGINVLEPGQYLAHLIPQIGVLTRAMPDKKIEKDILFGYDMAKKLAGEDIGQTIIVKNGTVVAVEAMEGTDRTIDRAGKIAGDGCVMVKVSRPDQDMRWDIPTVGVETMKRLEKNRFAALAIESGRMFLVDRREFLYIADNANIIVQAL